MLGRFFLVRSAHFLKTHRVLNGHRFAKLLYISADQDIVHVQWYEASSRTAMGEISDPQELFLLELCENRHVNEIRGQVKVHYSQPKEDYQSRVPPLDYFYKYVTMSTPPPHHSDIHG